MRQFARYLTSRITGPVSWDNGAFKQLSDLDASRYYHRIELNALTKLLLAKGVFTREELMKTMADEAVDYEKIMREEFPEVTPAEDGKSMTLDVERAMARMQSEGWPSESWPP